GKAKLFETWAQACLRVGAPPEVSTFMVAACELGDHPVGPLPESLNQAARAQAKAFLSERERAQPLGIYTWSPALSAIFRQDRYLMAPLEDEVAARLARGLTEDPGLGAAYRRTLQLAARMTNPPPSSSATLLSPRGAEKRRVLPTSRSHESDLLRI